MFKVAVWDAAKGLSLIGAGIWMFGRTDASTGDQWFLLIAALLCFFYAYLYLTIANRRYVPKSEIDPDQRPPSIWDR